MKNEDRLIISKHAVDRYIERVQEIDPDTIPLKAFKRRATSLKMQQLLSLYNEFSGRKGYYKLENNVFCLIHEGTVITTVTNSHSSNFRESIDITTKTKKEIEWFRNNKRDLRQQQRNRKRTNKSDENIYYGEVQKETSFIEELLEKERNKSKDNIVISFEEQKKRTKKKEDKKKRQDERKIYIPKKSGLKIVKKSSK